MEWISSSDSGQRLFSAEVDMLSRLMCGRREMIGGWRDGVIDKMLRLHGSPTSLNPSHPSLEVSRYGYNHMRWRTDVISFGLEKVLKASGNVGVIEERVIKPIEEFS